MNTKGKNMAVSWYVGIWTLKVKTWQYFVLLDMNTKGKNMVVYIMILWDMKSKGKNMEVLSYSGIWKVKVKTWQYYATLGYEH